MPNGGELTISTKSIPNKKNGYAMIQISDTGCGIKKENKNSIFDPFYTTKKNGTGLGLASVYRIIENHKGLIKVQSKESEGFSITLQLPFST
jgi:signal transduction histidine kinase